MPKTGAVIVAAGRGARMGGMEKALAPLAGEPLLLHSVRAFEKTEVVDEIVVVTRRDLLEKVHRIVKRAGCTKVKGVVQGGKTRGESSRHGLGALSKDVDLVLVHDGARPLVSEELIERVAEAAAETGAAIPGVTPTATIKRTENGASAGTVDRRELREAQTPQGFRRSVLARAFAEAVKEHYEGTDEAAAVERTGETVTIVEGDRKNLKVTIPEDLAVAEALSAGFTAAQTTRIGIGRDVHRLVEGRPLVLGGVRVPHPKGLLGHSDADVISHAICDALLGAAGKGDLGQHFPDTDKEWKGVSGAELLTRTVEILREVEYVPVNVDVTVCAQAPRLATYREEMIGNVARALRLPTSHVSVKFTTTEGLGFEGREEGISADAVVLVGRVFGESV